MVDILMERFQLMLNKLADNKIRNIVYVSLYSFFLAACDNGSSGAGKAPALLEGQFIDSAVSGLHYKTNSQSGLTDEHGTFLYQEGETITFSVGNTVLGVTLAQELITPFILSGHKALETESEILKALQSEQSSTFDKALNIATFLQSLDTDANPDNGIDLGNAHSTLLNTNTEALLFTKAHQFAQSSEFQEILNTLKISKARTLAESTNHLYSSLNINIHSAQPSKRFDLNASNDTPVQSYIYDSDGKLVELTVFNLKTQSEKKKMAFDYDANGNVINITDTINQQTETLSYNNQNLINEYIRTKDGQQTHHQTYDYNDNGISRFTSDSESSSKPQTTNFNYDKNGNLKTITLDSNGDDTSKQIANYSFANNRLIEYTQDSDANGKADIAISYRYDSEGNKISQSTRSSEETLSYTTSHFKYDANKNPVRYERDDNQDGIPEYIEAYKYNSANQRIQYQRDTNADGQWDFIAQYFYDVNGNRIRMLEDSDNNGLADKVWEAGYETAILADSWDRIMEEL